jgi:hypothetical protein
MPRVWLQKWVPRLGLTALSFVPEGTESMIAQKSVRAILLISLRGKIESFASSTAGPTARRGRRDRLEKYIAEYGNCVDFFGIFGTRETLLPARFISSNRLFSGLIET